MKTEKEKLKAEFAKLYCQADAMQNGRAKDDLLFKAGKIALEWAKL